MRKHLKIALWTLVAVVLLTLAALPVAYDVEREALDPERAESARDRYVKLSEGITYYEIAGPVGGTPVLLVAGFSVPSYIWSPTFDALAGNGFRVIRFDLYGRGMSDRPPGDYDRTRFERQMLELLAALGVDGKVDLVGLSMGGALVAGLAQNHPERVRKIVLVDPASTPRDIGALAVPFVGEWLFRTTRLPGMADGQLGDFAHPERFPDWAERYRVQMRYHGFGQALLSTLRHTSTKDPVLAFRTVGSQGIPVLLVWGEKDTTTPFELNALVRREVPQAEFLAVPDAGHLPHLEQPAVVEPVLIEFLRR